MIPFPGCKRCHGDLVEFNKMSEAVKIWYWRGWRHTQWRLVALKVPEGDSTEVYIDLQKNDDSYGIPHGTLNKKQTSKQ